MKVLFLGGYMSKDLADWLEQQGETIVYKEDKINIYDVKQINPDFIISYNYRYIIAKEMIDFVKGKAINLHISYLLWNKGAHPNVWSFLENTPKGVTIHYIDEGLDTGDIIVQKEVYVDEDKETLKSSYEILHKEMQVLFKENWEKIKSGSIEARKQAGGGASTSEKNLLNLSHLSGEMAGISQSKSLKDSISIRDLSLRNIEPSDINDLFRWRNHSETRKNSFNKNAVSWNEHERWFKAKSNDPCTTIFIACYKEEKIGSIRFENKGDVVKTSVMLNPDFLGKGFGPNVIKIGTKKFISEKRHGKPIIAEIKKDNISSLKAFQKAGFKESHLTFVYNP